MYLAAVPVEVTGERLYGKTSRASWVESCGRIVSTSVSLTETGSYFIFFFLIELFIVKYANYCMQENADAFSVRNEYFPVCNKPKLYQFYLFFFLSQKM